MQLIASLLFRLARVGRCPCCGKWTRFTRPTSPIVGNMPPGYKGPIILMSTCRRQGCTSSVRAITSLELRVATKES